MTKLSLTLAVSNFIGSIVASKAALVRRFKSFFVSRKTRELEDAIGDLMKALTSAANVLGQIQGRLVTLEGRVNGLHAAWGDHERQLLQTVHPNLFTALTAKVDSLMAYRKSDEKFMDDAKITNQIALIARHESKKTMESGLTQVLGGLVRQELGRLADTELTPRLADVIADKVAGILQTVLGEFEQNLNKTRAEVVGLENRINVQGDYIEVLQKTIQERDQKLAFFMTPKRRTYSKQNTLKRR